MSLMQWPDFIIRWAFGKGLEFYLNEMEHH